MGVGCKGGTDPKFVSPKLPAQSLTVYILPSLGPQTEVCGLSGCPPAFGASSGFLLLGEVEDLAVGLPQVLLLFEVHLKCPLDGHKGDTSQDGPLQVGVDAAEHELPHDGGDGGEDQSATGIRVADTWSARGLASAGIRGTGQPIPGNMLLRICSLLEYFLHRRRT